MRRVHPTSLKLGKIIIDFHKQESRERCTFFEMSPCILEIPPHCHRRNVLINTNDIWDVFMRKNLALNKNGNHITRTNFPF